MRIEHHASITRDDMPQAARYLIPQLARRPSREAGVNSKHARRRPGFDHLAEQRFGGDHGDIVENWQGARRPGRRSVKRADADSQLATGIQLEWPLLKLRINFR